MNSIKYTSLTGWILAITASVFFLNITPSHAEGTNSAAVFFRSGQSSLIRLRETKIKGSQYECRLIASLEGRGNMNGYTIIEGGAHFFYQTELEWHAEVLENDGQTLVERRRFKTSTGTAMLSVTEFGLSKNGSALAMGGIAKVAVAAGASTPGAGWIAVAVGELSRSDRLLKVPIIGSQVKACVDKALDKYGPNQVLKVATKTFGDLKGTEVVLTWKNGKLDSYKVITPGVVLSPEALACATRAGAFLDVNIFPDTGKRVGESWNVPAKDVADYFNAEPDLEQSVDGMLKVVRAADQLSNRVAVLTATGNASFSGEKYAADCGIDSLSARFHYATETNNKNQFLSYCRTSGTAKIKKIESGNMLFGLKVTTQPHYEIIYECEQK